MLLVGAGALVAALSVPSASRAATLVVTDQAFDAGSRGGIVTTAYIVPVAVTAGRYAISGYDLATSAAFAFQTYGYDLGAILDGGTYTTTTLGAAGVGAVKQAQINALISNTAAIANDADSSAAVQIVIWEILNEATSSLSATGGSFSAASSLSAPRTLANTYLGNISGNIWRTDSSYTIGLLSSPLKQSQIYWTVASQQAVPEPVTWVMFIAGFGAVGSALRWRKTVSAPSA